MTEVVHHLADLVAYPTVSARSNLALIDHLAAVTAPFGARLRRFPNAAGDKASLLVSIGPETAGGLLLSGHTDVVPVEGQAWTGDPWVLRTIGDRLVGRGTTDMKGFLAACLTILPEVTRAPLARPLHLAFSYDEEVGCTGVGEMAEWVGASDLNPGLAVIGEPTGMGLVGAHKGGLVATVHVRGKPGHSSQPDRYVNAVMIAAELVAEINRIRAEMRAGPRFAGLEPPYSTIQVNQISGGTAGNIVAETCDFIYEMRIVPGGSDSAVHERILAYARDMLEPAMHAIDPACGIDITLKARIPGLKPSGDEQLTGRLLSMLGRNEEQYVSYGTEAGIFQQAGVPSVIIGPGDIADAHRPDESIARVELDRCVAFLTELTLKHCRA